jgi:pantoate--beta-alanine ligase
MNKGEFRNRHTSRLRPLRTIAELREALEPKRRAGSAIGLVPTMGALHDGHLALIQASRVLCAVTVASLFVNPTQFGPGEDFAAYPRDEEADRRTLEQAGCDLLFAPGAAEIYPRPLLTGITVSPLGDMLEGAFRPGHFAGVATVVTKLLMIAQPSHAFFGEKDYQQLLVVRRLVEDLDIPVRIEAVPTLREPDGLALSSRNRYLAPAERAVAPLLYRSLADLAAEVADGRADCAAAAARATGRLRQAGFDAVDYLLVADAASLAPLTRVAGPARVLGGARIGRTRLIDNVPIG